MSRFLSIPLIKHTWRWCYRAPSIRVMLGLTLLGALVPDDELFQGMMILMPLSIGTFGNASFNRQDCIDLVLCRPLSKLSFVLSKWTAFASVVALMCAIHFTLWSFRATPQTASHIVACFCSVAVSASAGCLNRMLILDQRRQGTCIIVSTIFGSLCAIGIEHPIFPGQEAAIRLLYPTALGQGFALSFTAVARSFLNCAVLLLLSWVVIARQEISYSLD